MNGIKIATSNTNVEVFPGKDGKTMRIRRERGALPFDVQGAERSFLGASKKWKCSEYPTDQVLVMCADPLGTCGKHYREGRSYPDKAIVHYRELGIGIKRALARGGHVGPEGITVKLADFSPLEQSRMCSPEPYQFPEEVNTSRKRRRTEENEEEPSPSPSTQLIIPRNLNFDEATAQVVKRLPPAMRQDPTVAEYVAYRAMEMEWSAKDFYAWVDSKEAEERRKREDERRAAKRARRAGKIRECDVRITVAETFEQKFRVPCGKECGSDINLAAYYVVRDGELYTACCLQCYRSHLKAGKPGVRRVMERGRREAWFKHNGRIAEGPCYHCGVRGGLMHFYLDAWQGGHDIPASKGGTREADNMAPMHVRCNLDQGVESFDEYCE